MSEGTETVSLRAILGEELHQQLLEAGAFDITPFKPLAFYIPTMDRLYVMEQNCSITEGSKAGTRIQGLFHNGTGEQVGICIERFSELVPSFVLDAFKRDTPLTRRG